MHALVWGCMVLLVAIAFYTDHTRMIIPNKLTVSMTLIGMVLHAIMDGWQGLLHAVIGMIGSLAMMLAIYLCRGVEAGDVKLFAALGAIGGLTLSMTVLVYSLVIAAAIGIIVLAIRKLRSRSEAKSGQGLQFPFMYAVLPGFILTWVALEVPL